MPPTQVEEVNTEFVVVMGTKHNGLQFAGPQEQKFIQHVLSLPLEERARVLTRVGDAVWYMISADVRVSPALIQVGDRIWPLVKGELHGKTQSPYWLMGWLLVMVSL